MAMAPGIEPGLRTGQVFNIIADIVFMVERKGFEPSTP